jgi:hypothetical protein
MGNSIKKNMKINKKYLLFILFISSYGFAQTEDLILYEDKLIKCSGLMLGAHIARYPTLEIGYGKYTSDNNSKIPFSSGYSISVENYFVDTYTAAPKIAYWNNVLFLNFGVSVPWYFDFKGESSLKVRPEIGFGYQSFKVNFSYNISIYNKEMDNISKAMLSVNYLLPL